MGTALRVHVSARGMAPLKGLSFYADGQRIYEQDVAGSSFDQDVTIPNATDASWLTAQVIDETGLVSKPLSIRRPLADHPTRELHAVVIGNDFYADPELELKYAAHDADRLGATLKSLPGTFYARTTVDLLINSAATLEAIRGAIKTVIQMSKAEDTILISFAGHGLQDDKGGYYLTPYGFDRDDIQNSGLAWQEVTSLLLASKGRVIIVVDACHAGLTGQQGLGTNDDAVAALVSGQHPPMLVLAASKGRQASYEGSKWDGGVFTTALIEALKTKRADSDLDRDGAIEVSEIYRALRGTLARETDRAQSPWLVREDLLGDFVIF
jgi:hypothetical protein